MGLPVGSRHGPAPFVCTWFKARSHPRALLAMGVIFYPFWDWHCRHSFVLLPKHSFPPRVYSGAGKSRSSALPVSLILTSTITALQASRAAHCTLPTCSCEGWWSGVVILTARACCTSSRWLWRAQRRPVGSSWSCFVVYSRDTAWRGLLIGA